MDTFTHHIIELYLKAYSDKHTSDGSFIFSPYKSGAGRFVISKNDTNTYKASKGDTETILTSLTEIQQYVRSNYI